MDQRHLIIGVVLALAAGGGYAWWQNEQRIRQQRTEQLEQAARAAKAPAHARTDNPPLYKWKDDQGQWHITDQPPPNGLPFEKVQVNPDVNVLPVQ